MNGQAGGERALELALQSVVDPPCSAPARQLSRPGRGSSRPSRSRTLSPDLQPSAAARARQGARAGPDPGRGGPGGLDPWPGMQTVEAKSGLRRRKLQTDPVATARRRLELDRRLSSKRLSKVILTAEEEVGLTLIARPDGEPLEQGGFGSLTGEARAAAEAMVLHNIGLVHSISRGYLGQGLEYDDLVQSAMVGLLRAVELFDPAAGYKFSTYATHWIRQAVTRNLANEGRVIRLPVHMWELVRKVIATRQRLTVEGRGPLSQGPRRGVRHHGPQGRSVPLPRARRVLARHAPGRGRLHARRPGRRPAGLA